ncbi:MAG: hypothetical protein PHF87_08655, partial [Desulfotomaculaceae bacterium]|nr:hypothetical protein [Desulfotomaculaceae bacterium]
MSPVGMVGINPAIEGSAGEAREPFETTEKVHFLGRLGVCPDPILSFKQQTRSENFKTIALKPFEP